MKTPLFALMFALAVSAAVSATAQTITVGTGASSCGSSVSVPVSIGSASNVLAIEFRVSYNTSVLTLTDVTTGTLTSGFSLAKNASGGTVRVAMATGTAMSGSGTIANLIFSVASSASGTQTLSISNVLVNDVNATGVSGSITASCISTVQPPSTPIYTSPANFATAVASPVSLRWNGTTNTSYFRVRFGTINAPSIYQTTTSLSIDVPTVQNTTYYWSVEAVGDGGTAEGAVWKFTTAAASASCTTPAAPQLSGPGVDITSGNPFSLTWTAVSGATEYVLEEASDATFTNPATTTYTSTSAPQRLYYSITTSRYFRVRGRNTSSGCSVEGAKSNVVIVKIVPQGAIDSAARVVAVAGSLPGSFGSLFRTALQLHNPTSSVMRGRIVFHRQGSSGSSSDPTFNYNLGPGATTSWSDVVGATGTTGAIGSLDLIVDEGEAPLTVARIYNDGGASGTTGVAIDSLASGDALQTGQRAQLIAPIDPARARMNIGVRTLGNGATIELTLRDHAGTLQQTTRRTYAATWFEQIALSTLFSQPLTGNEVVGIEIISGSAIVYGAITDNVTQDPSVQFARAR